METLQGIVEVRRQNVGSRSEGNFTFLKTENGREFVLYRANVFPQGDAFLRSFDGCTISVDGISEECGYFCISALRLADGTPQPFPPKSLPPTPKFDFSLIKTAPKDPNLPLCINKKARSLFIKKGKKRTPRR